MRLPVVKLSTRRLLLTVALSALILWPIHECQWRSFYNERGSFHGMMSDFCTAEAELMERRAELCRGRGKSGVRWDDPAEDAETLRCCPYPSDVPKYGSWAEQAAIWERAAVKGRQAAGRHARVSRYYNIPL